MCTLTWRAEKDLEIFFNRDEMKTRGRATPPREHQTPDGTRYLSPIDPDAGGTWMLANEHGLVICLLNRWHIASTPREPSQPVRSRGQIVIALASMRSPEEVEATLPNFCTGAKAFDLVVLNHEEVASYTWDEEEITSANPSLPMTSSSYRFEAVKAAREEAFSRRSSLEQFQSSQNESCSAYTVRMNRPDAQTWSRSHLRLSPDSINWSYWEEFSDLAKEPQLHEATLNRN